VAKTGSLRAAGYLVDLGTWAGTLAEQMADADLLALEFNHDEKMELRSGRHPLLIQRVLGDEATSPTASGGLVAARVGSFAARGPRLLLQMHLSRECNAGTRLSGRQEVLFLKGAATRVFSTRQDERGTIHEVELAS